MNGEFVRVSIIFVNCKNGANFLENRRTWNSGRRIESLTRQLINRYGRKVLEEILSLRGDDCSIN